MNFFESYSLLTLLGLAFFPRITMFILLPWSGVFYVLGWIFAPHVVVAVLALPYWESNPLLVIGAWCFAVLGTAFEVFVFRSERKEDRQRQRNEATEAALREMELQKSM